MLSFAEFQNLSDDEVQPFNWNIKSVLSNAFDANSFRSWSFHSLMLESLQFAHNIDFWNMFSKAKTSTSLKKTISMEKGSLDMLGWCHFYY